MTRVARLADPFVAELEQEAATTKRVLERVPGDQLSWKPHEKSMSLGQLALHVATIPGWVGSVLQPDSWDAGQSTGQQEAATVEELVPALEESVRTAKDTLEWLDEEKAAGLWSITADGATLLSMPRIAVVRSIMLNHWYHHRGQLSVYLRLLNVPVPSIYGPSADEPPHSD